MRGVAVGAQTQTQPVPGVCAGVDAKQKGSWRVFGNTGSKGAHAILFANDLVLFMERPNWGVRPEPNSYLLVRLHILVMTYLA